MAFPPPRHAPARPGQAAAAAARHWGPTASGAVPSRHRHHRLARPPGL